jgi:hypothetical protein
MSSHSDGGIEVLTGKTPTRPDPTSTSISEHPDLGSVASRMRQQLGDSLPRYVAIPQKPYMTRPAYLGLQHGAFVVGDPSAHNYRPPTLKLAPGLDGRKLADREGLNRQFDQLRRGLDLHGQLEGMDQFHEQAIHMLTSAHTAQAFDLERENVRLQDRYGRHLWGQACLLARRLAEAGSSVISLFLDTPKTGPEFTNWDDHILNAGRPGHFAKYLKTRLPYLDQALATLIEDIYDRGLEQRILVLVLGEFGRTPRLSHNNQGVGRDHWPQAGSVLVSGGGLRMGQVIGATNAKGEYPAVRPCRPQDILATAYHHLGIDHRQSFTDHSGRPVPILQDGEPIAELL